MCVCTHAAYRNAVAMDWHFIDRLRSPFPHITNAIWLHVVVRFATADAFFANSRRMSMVAVCVNPVAFCVTGGIIACAFIKHMLSGVRTRMSAESMFVFAGSA